MNTARYFCQPLSLLLPLVLLPATQAAPLFYEGFDYPQGAELGDAITTTSTWENDKSQFTTVSGSLDYAGLKPSAGNRLNVVSVSPSLDSVRTVAGAWEAQTSGALYVSFLLKVESTNGIGTTGEGTSVLTLGKSSNNSHLLGINLLSRDGVKLGVLKYPSAGSPVSSTFFSSGTGANLPVNGSTTCLIVAKYEWVSGPNNDLVTAWVNPTNLGGAGDTENKISTNAGTDGTASAGRLTLSRGPHVNIDEIRIGQTWADVTPVKEPQHAAMEP